MAIPPQSRLQAAGADLNYQGIVGQEAQPPTPKSINAVQRLPEFTAPIPAQIQSEYQSVTEEPEMAKTSTSDGVSWGTFQWVITGLLVVIVALIGALWATMGSDVSDLKVEQRETRKEIADVKQGINDTRVELVKAIGGVEQKIAVTNQILDDVATALGKRK
jgi:hypothetical protein